MTSFNQKLSISFNSAILFYFLNLPTTYKYTSSLINKTLISLNCPTNLGIILHTFIFFAISYFSMSKSNIDYYFKLKHSIYGTLIYFFISSQPFYSFIKMLLNSKITNCPDNIGVLIQSILYCAALVGLMYLPN